MVFSRDGSNHRIRTDFFFRDHWEKLPKSWTESLTQMSTEELSWLVDKSQIRPSHVLPLSLMSFRACTQALSLDREPAGDIESRWRHLVPRTAHAECTGCESLTHGSGQAKGDRLEQISGTEPTSQAMGPVDKDGMLHYFYKKHVKPKKQHEIRNLAKVISLLSHHIGCSHVVDVGGGLGHLSRLLSFGYGFTVTSVEASDGHAPKAYKYDREVDKEIRKKKNQADTDPCSPVVSTNLPHHVTSMIYPNMSANDFLAIIKAHDHRDSSSGAAESLKNHKACLNPSNNTEISKYLLAKKHSLKDDTNQIASKVAKVDNRSYDNKYQTEVTEGCDKLTTLYSAEVDVSNVFSRSVTSNTSSQGRDRKYSKCSQTRNCGKIETDISKAVETDISKADEIDIFKVASNKIETDIFKADTIVNETDIFKVASNKIETDILKADMDFEESRYQTDSKSVQTADCDKGSGIQTEDDKTLQNQNLNSESKTSDDFILTGLHACGDLTPTFLRFFVNCPAARGLASVGCCYMKLSDSQAVSLESDHPNMGYPMSNFVRSLPNHELSYNARELACHFADTYSKRLKDNPPHLKIHSYRAALEWIANQLCPDFKRSAVQIPAKKTNNMDFESYARLGLQKFGISPDLLTSDLLNTATAMTERWKDVVAFYTLRLSLAPVVETLVLLDRMMLLHEHGVSSILMPIFDPNISPRNFVLAAWKQDSDGT